MTHYYPSLRMLTGAGIAHDVALIKDAATGIDSDRRVVTTAARVRRQLRPVRRLPQHSTGLHKIPGMNEVLRIVLVLLP